MNSFDRMRIQGGEVDVAIAFHPLGRHWHGGWVFPELTYPEFLARLAQLLKRHAAMVVNPRHPYHLLANSMVWLSDLYPRTLLRPIPSWFRELTHEPAA